MAGHSQFKNIMHRKGAQDKKKAKVFTRVSREITVATREGGSDPNQNPKLRLALAKAKDSNVPKEIIQRAIAKGDGSNKEGAKFEDILYEAFLPGGVGLLIEANTDNKNRCVSEVRSALTRHGGNLGESHSVSFLFKRQGLLTYHLPNETLPQDAIDLGAEDIFTWEDFPENCLDKQEGDQFILASSEAFPELRDALERKYGPAKDIQWIWRREVTMPLSQEKDRETLEKVLGKLEEIDDVYGLWHNANLQDPDQGSDQD